MIQAVLLSNDSYPCKKDREKRHREVRTGSTEMEAEEECCSHKPRISWSQQKLERGEEKVLLQSLYWEYGPCWHLWSQIFCLQSCEYIHVVLRETSLQLFVTASIENIYKHKCLIGIIQIMKWASRLVGEILVLTAPRTFVSKQGNNRKHQVVSSKSENKRPSQKQYSTSLRSIQLVTGENKPRIARSSHFYCLFYFKSPAF